MTAPSTRKVSRGGNGKRLRELLHRKVTETRAAAVRSEGKVSAEQLDDLERLARLVGIGDDAKSASLLERWPLVAAFVVTLGLVSVLVFVPMRTTEIELELKAEEVGFDLSTGQTLTTGLKVTAIGVSGLSGVHLPRGKNRSGKRIPASDEDWTQVRVEIPEAVDDPNGITLAPLDASGGSRVWLRSTDNPGNYDLSVRNDKIDVTVNLSGWLRVKPSRAKVFDRDFGRGRQMKFQSGTGVMDLTVTPTAPAKGWFSGPLTATDLSFVRVHRNVRGTAPVEVSTILDGTIYFLSLGSKKHTLRPREMLRFATVEGEIRSMQPAEDHVAVSFHGQVSGMTTGSETQRRSLMPSVLEWLRAQHALEFMWGTALYIFGLVIAVLRWWRPEVV